MATVMHPRSHHVMTTKSSIQKVCIGMGVLFILIGLAGVMMPGFMSMHLSMAHNLIHIASGALALWAGYSDSSKKAFNFALAFAAVYGLLGIAGFIVGQPGYPGIGHLDADQNLLRIIPNVLEFGSADHVVHILISAVLFSSAYLWRKKDLGANHSLVDVQRRKAPGSDAFKTTRPFVDTKSNADLSKADLGKSDVNRAGDLNRRNDFEGRL